MKIIAIDRRFGGIHITLFAHNNRHEQCHQTTSKSTECINSRAFKRFSVLLCANRYAQRQKFVWMVAIFIRVNHAFVCCLTDDTNTINKWPQRIHISLNTCCCCCCCWARVINAFFVLRDANRLTSSSKWCQIRRQIKFIIVKTLDASPSYDLHWFSSISHTYDMHIQISMHQMVIFYSPSYVDIHIECAPREGPLRRVELIRFDVWLAAYAYMPTYFSPICDLFSSVCLPFAVVCLGVIAVSLNEFLRLHLQNRYIIVCDKMRF